MHGNIYNNKIINQAEILGLGLFLSLPQKDRWQLGPILKLVIKHDKMSLQLFKLGLTEKQRNIKWTYDPTTTNSTQCCWENGGWGY